MKVIKYIGTALSTITTFLLSLVLAIIIWVTANQANDPTIIKPLQIPLEVNVPSNAVLITPTNPTINVSITAQGPASVLENISSDDFTTSIDLSNIPYGSAQTMPILVQQLSSGFTFSNQDPLDLVIHLENLVSREIDVMPEIRGEVARGHSMGEVILNPQKITVTGRESIINALNFAQVTLFLNNDRETLIDTRPFVFYDDQDQVASVRDLQISTRDVEVTVPITEAPDFAEKFITLDIVGEPAAGYRILSTNVEPSNVLIQGRPAQLDILANVKTEPVDITGLTESFVTLVSLDLPDGVALDEFTEIEVTVEIAPFQSAQTFRRVVQVQGLGEGLEAELSDETVRVVLFGPSPVLQALAEDEVTVSLDLFDLEIGTHSGLMPDVDFPDRGLELRSIDPTVISAMITQTMTMTNGISTTESITSTSFINMNPMLNTAVHSLQADEKTIVERPLFNGRFAHKPEEIELL